MKLLGRSGGTKQLEIGSGTAPGGNDVREQARRGEQARKGRELDRRGAGRDRRGGERVLLPFTNQAISRRAFEAAIRIAKADGATVVPAFLARVPRNLPIDSPLPAACAIGMPLLETMEQRFTAEGIPVDSRVSRGRTYRDALERLLKQERFDRVIISATVSSPRAGLSQDDLGWLLRDVPAEVLILRPAPDDDRRITAAGFSGHF